MDPDGSTWLYFILFLTLFFGAFFAAGESAIVNMHDQRIKKLADDGDERAAVLLRLTESPSRFLISMKAGRLLSVMMSVVVADIIILQPMFYSLRYVNNLSFAASLVISYAWFILFGLFMILLLFRLIPQRIGAENCEKIALSVAHPMYLLFRVGMPFIVILSGTQNFLLKVFGIDPNAELGEVTEEEIRMMIDAGEESGNIEEEEKDMINNIFEFDDHTASDMMTHRTEIEAAELGTPLAGIVEIAASSGYSRLPIYEDDLDTIVGILHVKDLLRRVTATPDEAFNLSDYLREPLYVLESAGCKSLLSQLKAMKIQMAVVVDEYGGTSGIVTMEDLLESIVGSIRDEYDEDEEDTLIEKTSESSYVIDGLTPLEEVAELLGLTPEEDEESETIGGYVTNLLGYIPTENETPQVQAGNVIFQVDHMEERRIARLLVRVVDGLDTGG